MLCLDSVFPCVSPEIAGCRRNKTGSWQQDTSNQHMDSATCEHSGQHLSKRSCCRVYIRLFGTSTAWCMDRNLFFMRLFKHCRFSCNAPLPLHSRCHFRYCHFFCYIYPYGMIRIAAQMSKTRSAHTSSLNTLCQHWIRIQDAWVIFCFLNSYLINAFQKRYLIVRLIPQEYLCAVLFNPSWNNTEQVFKS